MASNQTQGIPAMFPKQISGTSFGLLAMYPHKRLLMGLTATRGPMIHCELQSAKYGLFRCVFQDYARLERLTMHVSVTQPLLDRVASVVGNVVATAVESSYRNLNDA